MKIGMIDISNEIEEGEINIKTEINVKEHKITETISYFPPLKHMDKMYITIK